MFTARVRMQARVNVTWTRIRVRGYMDKDSDEGWKYGEIRGRGRMKS